MICFHHILIFCHRLKPIPIHHIWDVIYQHQWMWISLYTSYKSWGIVIKAYFSEVGIVYPFSGKRQSHFSIVFFFAVKISICILTQALTHIHAYMNPFIHQPYIHPYVHIIIHNGNYDANFSEYLYILICQFTCYIWFTSLIIHKLFQDLY